MHLSSARRAYISKSRVARNILSSSTTSLSTRSKITHWPPNYAIQVRALWWWSRHGSEWNTQDEGLDERMRRYQKIMRYRYSKALRRRAMWDREESHRLSWPWTSRWLSSRWADSKNLTSGRSMQANVHDQGKGLRKDEDPWEDWNKQWNQDYESFKAAVDKAIDRDPHGTLFGRHLRSPMSARNSGWTAWSWVFEPKEPVDPGKKAEPEASKKHESTSQQPIQPQQSYSSVRATFSVPPRSPTSSVKPSPTLETEYEIDPISMRKVPKAKEAPSPESPKKPFWSSLLSEHGAVDIPVKIYKPPRVYGYGLTSESSKKDTAKTDQAQTVSSKPIFESSRLQQIRDLKAKTLGNSIDTSAEFGGKYVSEDDIAPIRETEPEPKKERKFEVEDEAPLFSGTTYQSRANDITVLETPKGGWLQKEGFQTMKEALKTNESEKFTPSINKIEPSLDRMKTIKPDRETSLKKVLLEESYHTSRQNQYAEDFDLLRASDVRAAARTARRTKQDILQAKNEAREKLETDFVARQHATETTNPQESASTLAKNLQTAWKHIAEYPTGVVARTMQSLGVFNDNYKKYIRLDKPATDLTEKLVFKDHSLSKTPSIYKKSVNPMKSIETFTPSQEFIQADLEEQARTAALKEAAEQAKKDEAKLQAQAIGLASEIRNAYESEYGPIDVNHRHVPPVQPTAEKIESSEAVKKPHSLQIATVKPGVETNAEIEYHMREFEPKFAQLVDQARTVKRSTHELSQAVRAMKSRRPQTYWNNGQVTAMNLARGNAAVTEPITSPEISPSPLAAFLNEAEKPTLLFLAYSPKSDRVEISPLSNKNFRRHDLYHGADDMSSVLTSLNHPSKYMEYFAALENEGYELFKGGQESLIFRRSERGPGLMEKAKVAKSNVEPDKIAAEEAAAQPVSELSPPSLKEAATVLNELPIEAGPQPAVKEAATVLNELPIEAKPQPGPAAPTAPPSSMQSRMMQRQEPVFSGQSLGRRMRHRRGDSKKQVTIDDILKASASLQDTTAEAASSQQEQKPPREGMWTRFKRGLRKTILTGLAMAGVAYGIGVAAESVGAQQPQRVIRDGNGREMRIGRPGIYSTENSR